MRKERVDTIRHEKVSIELIHSKKLSFDFNAICGRQELTTGIKKLTILTSIT